MDTVEELLTRGVENIIPGKEKLRELLASGKKLNIYLGIDPTATQIHLGHAVPLRKLQRFAQLGHHVTFLIGDFTALIGDTSDKDSERPSLTKEEIEHNFQTYKAQAEKLLDFSKITVRHNSEWLSKLSYAKIIELMQHFSAGDFFNRELIKRRLSEGKKVGLHEIMYPVMQGYDSYTMDTDIQLGGTDQTFNMQAGRILQKDFRKKESFILANGFLTGTDGRKMSKTWNNAVWLTDEPNDMFGKIMSLKDELIKEYFLLATNVSMITIEDVTARLDHGENPMVLKKELATVVVTELHSKEKAQLALQSFEKTFQKKDPTSDMITVFHTDKDTVDIMTVLVESGLCKSKSEAKRLIIQKGIDEESIRLDNTTIKVNNDKIYKIGKKRFLVIKKNL